MKGGSYRMFNKSLMCFLLLPTLLLSGCIITGKVTDGDGNGIEGVTVTLTGDANLTTTTNSKGGYIFGNFFDVILGATSDEPVIIMPGSYTVTPSKTGYTFTPASTEVSVTSSTYGPLGGDIPWPVGGVNFNVETSPRVGCEILEFQSINSIRVWINLDMTLEEFNAIPIPSIDEIQFPQGWFKNQPRVGEGGPDAGRFLRSPGAAVDGEFIVEEHFGHMWTHNATVIQINIPMDNQGLLTATMVAKFHEVTFNAGRTITVLFSPEDDPYVLIGRDLNRTSDEPSIPNLWRLVEYTTPDQLVIMLPEETMNIRADNEDSFQGPVPELAVALE